MNFHYIHLFNKTHDIGDNAGYTRAIEITYRTFFLNDQRLKNIKFSTTLNNQIYCQFKILGKILTYLGYKEYDGKKKPRLTVHQFSSPRTLREKNSAYGPYCF